MSPETCGIGPRPDHVEFNSLEQMIYMLRSMSESATKLNATVFFNGRLALDGSGSVNLLLIQ